MKPTFCQCCSRKYESPDDYLSGTSRFRVCSRHNLWFECSCGSGLVLKQGDYEWYSPTLQMSDAAATIFKNVQEISNIPLLPTAVMKLQTLICDQTSSTRDIKQALLQTPHLALGVINTANQRRRSTGHEIKSLEHAVSFIGRQAVSDLVLTETLQAFDFKTVEFNKHQYWQEAILTGQIAEYLAAQYAPELSPEEAYIAGSLCNIGKVVAAICLPMMADDVARATTNPRRPMNWVEAEHRLRAISHIALGEVAGAMWGFPEYVIHSLANHHTPPAQVPDLPLDPIAFLEADDEQDTKGPSMQQVVALANQYTHWVSGQLPRLDEPLLHQYTTIFQLDETQQTDLGHELIKAFHLPAS